MILKCTSFESVLNIKFNCQKGGSKVNNENKVQQVLQEILEKPQLTSQNICMQYQLSKGQLNYLLKKINDSLAELNLSEITRTKHGRFIVNDDVRIYFEMKQSKNMMKSIPKVFTNEERFKYIQLMIISRTEFLSVDHFTDSLNVSRNTILRDLKEIAQTVREYGVELVYNRQDGYHFTGDEWNIRVMLMDLVNEVATFFNGLELIYHFANIDTEEIQEINQQLILIEEDLQIRFTDEKLRLLPINVILIVRRILLGQSIKYNFNINTTELADTKEYLALKRMINTFPAIDDAERIYLVIILLTSNLSKGDLLSYQKLYRLREAIQQMLVNFEQISSIELVNKEKLLDELFIHMKPAYYRIKYRMNFQNKYLLENRDSNITMLMNFIRLASGPLRSYFDTAIPENELFFIAIFIGGHIKERHENYPTLKRPRAVVVCPNGISISVLLHSTLEQLLPEIEFIGSVSIRDFQQHVAEYNVDFVFSPIQLVTDKKVFIVNNFINESEKQLLRNRVLQEISNVGGSNNVTVEKLLDIIRRYTVITNEKDLYEELSGVLQMDQPLILKRKSASLVDFLVQPNVQLFKDQISWKELIKSLGQPLLENKIVEQGYIEAIIDDIDRIQEYSIFNNKIVVLHADPEMGVNDLGITFGICEEPLTTIKGIEVRTVVFLASNEKSRNVDMIFELMELANSPFLDELEKATTKEEVVSIIKKVCGKYWSEKYGK